MKDKIIQISTHYQWTGNWEDSQNVVYGLGESGKLYILNQSYDSDTKSSWIEECESPEIINK